MILAMAAPASAAVKAPVTGLLDRHKPVSTSYIKGWVIDVPWSALQPTSSTQLVTTAIDSDIAKAKSLGKTAAKLRVGAGIDAPAWVKNLAGGPITMYDISQSTTGGTFTCPKFWRPEVMAAYTNLNRLLAARYDANPVIRQVILAGPIAQHSEPYLRDGKDSRNVAALLNAGFTVAQDKVAHDANMAVGNLWLSTNVEIPFNPYQAITPTKKYPDVAYTIAEMQQFRTMFGSRAILANNSIASTRTSDVYTQMYAAQKSMGRPLSYQTATFNKIGDYKVTLNFAVAQGASSVELPTGYTAWPASVLTTYSNLLR
jgi:hypothetical protein